MNKRQKKGFTTGEVAELCHVTIPTVIKWMESGELEGFKIPHSKNRRVAREHLLSFMKKYNIPTTELEEKKIKILAVDDEQCILELLKELLVPEKYEVRLVARGFDAGLAKEFRPDLIILDIFLPDIQGDKVCEYIRSMPEMQDVKILAISGYIENDELEELLRKGFDDYLKKPFENKVLLQKVENLLNKTQSSKGKKC